MKTNKVQCPYCHTVMLRNYMVYACHVSKYHAKEIRLPNSQWNDIKNNMQGHD